MKPRSQAPGATKAAGDDAAGGCCVAGLKKLFCSTRSARAVKVELPEPEIKRAPTKLTTLRNCPSLPLFATLGEATSPRGGAFQSTQQLVVLQLSENAGVESGARAVVVFHPEMSERALWPDSTRPFRWTLPFSSLDRGPGIHTFHFMVKDRRVLSDEHPVRREANVALFSDSLRKYIESCRRGRLDAKRAPNHIPFNRISSLNDDSPNKVINNFPHDDIEVGEKTRTGTMVRPHTIGHKLADLADYGEPLEAQDVIERPPSVFSAEVYDGLYDSELQLRLDRFVFPQHISSHASPSTQLWAGSSRVKKVTGNCEDACFANTQSLGVADGVGGMAPFASYGVDAAKYASELMELAATCLRKHSSKGASDLASRAVSAVRSAAALARSYGASTILVAVAEGSAAGVANLGDCGFMLLRRKHQKFEIALQSTEQHHRWNCPFQLTRLPQELQAKFPDFAVDSAADCDKYSFTLQAGDLLLLYSDGLRDNLHDHEILHVVECALPPLISELVGLPEHATAPEALARALTLAAQQRSLDPRAKVPFAENCRKYGYQFEGGKQDDITVVAAWVMPETRSSVGLDGQTAVTRQGPAD